MWQPIETVPKEPGRPIVLWGGTIEQSSRGCWGNNTGAVAEWVPEPSWSKEKRDGYWEIFDSDGVVFIANPTHWMPCDPPVAEPGTTE